MLKKLLSCHSDYLWFRPNYSLLCDGELQTAINDTSQNFFAILNSLQFKLSSWKQKLMGLVYQI